MRSAGKTVIFMVSAFPMKQWPSREFALETPIRRVANLMHEAYGSRATDEALSRAIEYRSDGDEIGFDVWSSVAVAIGQDI